MIKVITKEYGAICNDCGKAMLHPNSKSCDAGNTFRINKKNWKRDTTYYDVNKRCHDCGIENKKGNVHHWGCDMERCPKCKGQLISCGCWEEQKMLLFNKD